MERDTLRGTRLAGMTSLAPMVCAVHCLAAPVLALVAPAFLFTPLAEGSLMVAAVGLSTLVLVEGTRRHGRRGPWIPAVAGVAIWSLVPLGMLATWPEPAVVMAGGLALFGGMGWNARLKARAETERCGCPACGVNGRV